MPHTLKNILFFIVALFLFSGDILAEKKIYTHLELINLADRQLTRTQRFAKNYFYIHKGISVAKAKQEQKKSLKKFSETLNILHQSTSDEHIQNIIMFVKMNIDSLLAITAEPFSIDNGILVVDLSESMLEGSQNILDSLKKNQKKTDSRLVEMAGKQRVLSQRIAKYYIAYQSGVRDENSITQMKNAVDEFDDIHKTLMSNKSNDAKIYTELKKVDKLWKIVYKFYLSIDKGGLPIIVNSSTEEIRKRMNKVVYMYVDLSQANKLN